MKPTEQLKEEHQAIKVMLRISEKVCQKLESGEEVNPEHLEQMVEFIKVFADKCHHGKEEDLLFTAMEEAGIPKESGPIGVMLTEHDMGRGYVRGMSEAVVQYKAGDRKASSARQAAQHPLFDGPLAGYHSAKERVPIGKSYLDAPVRSGDRLGFFPANMAMLVV